MTDKLFTVAGTSKVNGSTKVRFANDMTRVKVLVKGGHDNIDLLELPRAMTKSEVVSYLMAIDFSDGNVEKAEAIQREATKRKVELQAAKPTKAKKTTVADTVMSEAKAKASLADMEDAPF
jgi:hypothetical protein